MLLATDIVTTCVEAIFRVKSGAVYKIKMLQLPGHFFSVRPAENLTMGLSKHAQATKNGGLNNNIAKHYSCFIYSTD